MSITCVELSENMASIPDTIQNNMMVITDQNSRQDLQL